MDIDDVKKRYEALGEVPAVPGEREWVDRITTFEDFMTRGPEVVAHFNTSPDMQDNREWLRNISPGHWDLLFEVFS